MSASTKTIDLRAQVEFLRANGLSKRDAYRVAYAARRRAKKQMVKR